mgnify:CR=1 FL=1
MLRGVEWGGGGGVSEGKNTSSLVARFWCDDDLGVSYQAHTGSRRSRHYFEVHQSLMPLREALERKKRGRGGRCWG